MGANSLPSRARIGNVSQRRAFLLRGAWGDPAVNQIWAEWCNDGSGLKQRWSGMSDSATALSVGSIVLIYGQLTLTWSPSLARFFSEKLCWLASCYLAMSLWIRMVRISANRRSVFGGPGGCHATERSAGVRKSPCRREGTDGALRSAP